MDFRLLMERVVYDYMGTTVWEDRKASIFNINSVQSIIQHITNIFSHFPHNIHKPQSSINQTKPTSPSLQPTSQRPPEPGLSTVTSPRISSFITIGRSHNARLFRPPRSRPFDPLTPAPPTQVTQRKIVRSTQTPRQLFLEDDDICLLTDCWLRLRIVLDRDLDLRT